MNAPQTPVTTITACTHCHDVCEETLFQHNLKSGGKLIDQQVVVLLSDCIQICQTTADILRRSCTVNSSQVTSVCRSISESCAEICETVAQVCEKITDERLQRCVQACRRCAETCRKLATEEVA